MGHRDHVGLAQQCRLGEVTDVFAQPALGQTAPDRLGVHDGLACKVEQHGAWLDESQRIRVDHVSGGVHGGHVQRDIVGPGQQRRQVFHSRHLAGEAPGGVYRQRGIKTQHLHAHRQCHVGDHRTDGTEANNAQRLALDFTAGKAGFFLFQQLRHGVGVGQGRQRVDIGDAGQDTPCCEQHAGHYQFLHRVGIGTRRIEDHNALLAVVGDRYIVDAGTSAGHRQQRPGHFDIVQFLAAQQKRIGVTDVATDLIRLAGKPLQPADRYLVVGSDLVHALKASLR